MPELSFEDILLCDASRIDPSLSTGLWWCQSAEDVLAVGYNAVSLSMTGRWEDVQYCAEWLSTFPYIFVASPDRELLEKVKTHVRCVPILSPRDGAFGGYPSVLALRTACGPAKVEELLYGARVEPRQGLLNLADVRPRDDRNTPRTLTGFGPLDRATGGFRDGELSVWTGKRGEGKSTFLGQVLLESIDQGHKVCAYSGELPSAQFKSWVQVQAAGPDFLQDWRDPETGETLWTAQPGAARFIDAWWDGKFYLIDIGSKDAHDENYILDSFEYAHRALGCDVFLVDNIMTARLTGDRDYYRSQSLFAARLTQFAKGSASHVHLVAHPRKTDGRAITDGDEVSGTGDIVNLADLAFSISRLSDEDAEKNGFSSSVRILKNRGRGVQKIVGMNFDPASRRFYPVNGNPGKRYGWAYLGKQTTLEELGAEPVPFEEN